MRKLIVFLHGSGSNGSELGLYLQSVPLQQFGFQTFFDVAKKNGFEIYTPTAKRRRYTPYGGDYLNVWFDRSSNFVSKGLGDTEDLVGIDASLNEILSYVSSRDYGTIFFGGFSMGGGLSLHVLRNKLQPRFKGVFSFGSFLVDNSEVFKNSTELEKLPVMMMHGDP